MLPLKLNLSYVLKRKYNYYSNIGNESHSQFVLICELHKGVGLWLKVISYFLLFPEFVVSQRNLKRQFRNNHLYWQQMKI